MVAKASIVGFLLLAGALSACGGSGTPQSSKLPRIPAAVAGPLAVRSDAVATSLERGDACSAAGRITALEQAVRRMVTAGRVPRAFRRQLLRTVEAIKADAPACEGPPTSGDGGDRAHEHGKHKGRGRDEGGDQGDEG